jgi:hypothetical protein
MKTILALLCLCLVPAPSSADEYAAGGGKQEIYHRSGRIVGGRMTDGKDVCGVTWSDHGGFERIVVAICEASWDDTEPTPADAPCRFSVTKEVYPERLVFTFSGTRRFTAELPFAHGDGLVSDSYPIIYLDDAGAMFAVEFSRPVEFEVFESRAPGRIIVDVRSLEPDSVYSLRSASMKLGEGIGHMQEHIQRLGGRDARILKDDEGAFFVEAGTFRDREEAERMKRILFHGKVTLYIEKRPPDGRPAYIPEAHDERE